MKKLCLNLVLLCIICCFNSCKKEVSKDIAYANFVVQLNEKDIKTGNILVYKNGEIIYKNADGIQNIDGNVPLTLNSQFRLASVSKQFTGMAIMKLKEQGKLDYDQSVKSILSDFPYPNITVRHLLNHVSGITDYEALLAKHYKPSRTKENELLGNDEIIEIFYRVKPPLDFQPEEKWDYSNTGYLFLASIVEKLAGQHFREFLKEHIFDPLEMNNSELYKYQIAIDPNKPNRVFGYEKELDQVNLKPNDYNLVNDVRGDGGIFSTLEDLYKWNQALVNYTIIPKEYLEEAWKPTVLKSGEVENYAFGWGIKLKDEEVVAVSHSGGWVGFATFLYNDIQTNSGFVYLSNNSGENFGQILTGLFSILEGKPFQRPKLKIEAEMAKTMYSASISDGIEVYHTLKKDTVNYRSSERDLNVLGYQLMNEDKMDGALAVFKLNMEEYPNSANTYDSYGDALLEKGDSLNALKHFQKSFAMDSTSTISKEKADSLMEVLN